MIILTFIIITLHWSQANNDQVYYENLIRTGIERSSTYQLPKDASEFRPHNDVPKIYGTYDFVIIGAGSAGSVIASRLSEIEDWKILLIEAGKEENNFTIIPEMWTYLQNLEYNWGFNSTPQKCCQASNGICSYPRGKSLGGSSAINGMMYTRGSRFDYDNWGRQGNDGWFYDDVLKFFIKSENSHINGSTEYHGTDGYLNINYHEPVSTRTTTFFNACRELNIPIVDINGQYQIGADRIQYTINNGQRQSTAKAFLTPAHNRKNLEILTESYVTNIQISNFSRAEGVIFSYKNVKYIAKVNKEVILSAGVIGSPHILMLSGIGPKEHLSAHQISITHDLAVGKVFHDHLGIVNLDFLLDKPELPLSLHDSVTQYLKGMGPLTLTSNYEALSLLSLENTNLTIIEIIQNSNLNIFDTPVTVWESSTSDNYIIRMMVALITTKSRGNVSLKSSNPYDYPLINVGCLTDAHDEDKENMYKTIQTAINLLSTNAFKSLNPSHVPYPPCKRYGYLTKAYWMCFIEQNAGPFLHGGGTCRMGPDPKEGAVVNNKLKVYGVSNLRVADASIIPNPLAAHTNAPSIMIGERAADFIKTEYAIN